MYYVIGVTLPTLLVNVILHLNAEFLLQKQWKPAEHMGETLPPRASMPSLLTYYRLSNT